MAKKSRRRRSKAATKQQQLLGDLSLDLDGECDHGLNLNVAPEIEVFLKLFRRECMEGLIKKDPNDSASLYFAAFGGFTARHCERGVLSNLNLCMNDIETMTGVFVAWGTDSLVKHKSCGDANWRLAQSLAMLHYLFSQYSEVDNRSFQSYILSLDYESFCAGKQVTSFEIGPHCAARFFASKICCQCIPNNLTCEHGIENPPPEDPVNSFKIAYEEALRILSNKNRLNAKGEYLLDGVRANMVISRQFRDEGLSHLWDHEEKRAKIISYLVSLGTDCMSSGESWKASVIAVGVKVLEETKSFYFMGTSKIDDDNQMDLWWHEKTNGFEFKGVSNENDIEVIQWYKMQTSMLRFQSDIDGDSERKLTKFFISRKNCSCLKEKYNNLKTDPKKGMCQHCRTIKDRSQMKICQGCRSINYCCRSCQRADWPNHKGICHCVTGLKQCGILDLEISDD